MIRKIITIDEEKCTGCGLCAEACHEGAIGIVDGKAKLLRDDYCDGLGDCLPSCPVDAISFTEREAAAYDEKAVQENKAKKSQGETLPCGCPGTHAEKFERNEAAPCCCGEEPASQLGQWPVQIRLLAPNAPYFNGAELLVAADCTAYAYANMHNRFMHGKVTLIGCPKLDDVDYSEKLTEIISGNDIKSVTVVRMEVPCCGGIENAVKAAVSASGKNIPVEVVVISTRGQIIQA